MLMYVFLFVWLGFVVTVAWYTRFRVKHAPLSGHSSFFLLLQHFLGVGVALSGLSILLLWRFMMLAMLPVQL